MKRVALKGICSAASCARRSRPSRSSSASRWSAAAFVLTDTISKAFDSIFSSSYDKTDVVVSGRKLVDWSTQRQRARLAASCCDRCVRCRASHAAAGQILDLNSSANTAKLIDQDGEIDHRRRQPDLRAGRRPVAAAVQPAQARRRAAGRRAPGEVVIDASTRDTARLQGRRPRSASPSAGPCARSGSSGSRSTATSTRSAARRSRSSTCTTAQRLLVKPGYDGDHGRRPRRRLARQADPRHRDARSPANAQVRTAAEQATADKKGVSEFIDFIRCVARSASACIALFVGAFVIFNTLSITVAQRTRELATLRTLGATRRQVLRPRRPRGVRGRPDRVADRDRGRHRPREGADGALRARRASTCRARRWSSRRGRVVVSLLLGTLVTLAGLDRTGVPGDARLADRRRARGRDAPARPLRATVVPDLARAARGSALAVLGFGLFVPGGSTLGRVLSLALGALALFVGVAIVSTRLVTPLARVLGWPVGPLRRRGRAARAAGMRSAMPGAPRRPPPRSWSGSPSSPS